MMNLHTRDYPQIFPVYPAFEAAGYTWTTVAKFEEKGLSDELLLKIQFQNDEGTTRLLKLDLSKTGVCTDVRGKYHGEVMAEIQGWLWSEQQQGQISHYGA